MLSSSTKHRICLSRTLSVPIQFVHQEAHSQAGPTNVWGDLGEPSKLISGQSWDFFPTGLTTTSPPLRTLGFPKRKRKMFILRDVWVQRMKIPCSTSRPPSVREGSNDAPQPPHGGWARMPGGREVEYHSFLVITNQHPLPIYALLLPISLVMI